MKAEDVYRQARQSIAARWRVCLRQVVTNAMVHPGACHGMVFERLGIVMSFMASVEGEELHVSVSRVPEGKKQPLPSWDDLVAVRASIWPDAFEVHQVLPAGDDEWVNITEALHLRGPIP